MEVRCDKCQARYRVDDNRIGPQGLTLRCGKCQNTFKVTRSPPPAPETAAPPPKAPPAQTTMIFAAPPVAAKPSPRPAAAPAPAPDEAAGRTMMFPSAPQPMRETVPPPKRAPEPPASGTIVFSQPAVRPSPAKPPPPTPTLTMPPAAKAPDGDAPRATMIFGSVQSPQKAPEPALAPAARTEVAEPVPAEEDAADDTPGPDEALEAKREPGPFDKAPPRGLLIGVAAGLALLLVIGGTLVAYRKLARHPPPPAAVEMLTSARVDADLDTLASLASAETKARDALDLAGDRSRFPEATAALARIGIQWADALNDEAARISESNAGDPRVAQLQGEARGKLKTAFDLLSAAVKGNKDSKDLQLALADYYRAQRAPSSMNRYLKGSKDDPRAALIQGMALLDADEGAEKAIPGLKAALATDPRSARVHFRLAQAYVAARDDANARAEVEETLRLSPQHERAQALQKWLGKAGAAEKK